ncbi:MAG: hypothetical protein AAGA99_26390 [Actinomycetota bacterium]
MELWEIRAILKGPPPRSGDDTSRTPEQLRAGQKDLNEQRRRAKSEGRQDPTSTEGRDPAEVLRELGLR